jgi:hypothetical protein
MTRLLTTAATAAFLLVAPTAFAQDMPSQTNAMPQTGATQDPATQDPMTAKSEKQAPTAKQDRKITERRHR